jgi:hypothetical protein
MSTARSHSDLLREPLSPREASRAIWIADSNYLRARKNTGTESPPVHAKKKPGLSAGMRKRPALRQASAMGAATGFSFWTEANAFPRDNLRLGARFRDDRSFFICGAARNDLHSLWFASAHRPGESNAQINGGHASAAELSGDCCNPIRLRISAVWPRLLRR